MVLVRRVTEGEARRSAVERANDGTLEVVIFTVRLLAGLNTLAAIVSALALVWTADLRWLVTLVLTIIWGGVFGWLGFWTWGNADWKNDG
jgi:fatty acid desaturase